MYVVSALSSYATIFNHQLPIYSDCSLSWLPESGMLQFYSDCNLMHTFLRVNPIEDNGTSGQIDIGLCPQCLLGMHRFSPSFINTPLLFQNSTP